MFVFHEIFQILDHRGKSNTESALDEIAECDIQLTKPSEGKLQSKSICFGPLLVEQSSIDRVQITRMVMTVMTVVLKVKVCLQDYD